MPTLVHSFLERSVNIRKRIQLLHHKGFMQHNFLKATLMSIYKLLLEASNRCLIVNYRQRMVALSTTINTSSLRHTIAGQDTLLNSLCAAYYNAIWQALGTERLYISRISWCHLFACECQGETRDHCGLSQPPQT